MTIDPLSTSSTGAGRAPSQGRRSPGAVGCPRPRRVLVRQARDRPQPGGRLHGHAGADRDGDGDGGRHEYRHRDDDGREDGDGPRHANGPPPGLDAPSYYGRLGSLGLFARAASDEATANSPVAQSRYAVIRQETGILLSLVNGALTTTFTLPTPAPRPTTTTP